MRVGACAAAPSSSYLQGGVPWRASHVTWFLVLNLSGFVSAAAGWVGASGTVRLSHQFGWAAVSVAGLVMAALGNGVWLLAGRRAIGVRRTNLLPFQAKLAGSDADAVAAVKSDPVRVVGRRMTRYHRGDCILVAGKPVTNYTRQLARTRRAQPCGICRP